MYGSQASGNVEADVRLVKPELYEWRRSWRQSSKLVDLAPEKSIVLIVGESCIQNGCDAIQIEIVGYNR